MIDISEQFGFLDASQQGQLLQDQLLTRPLGMRINAGEVLVGVNPQGHRHVLIPTHHETIRAWSTAGIRLDLTAEAGRAGAPRYLILKCHLPRLNEVFSHMVSDLLNRLGGQRGEPIGDPHAMTVAVLEEWKELFARSGAGLSREQQIGLFAELDLLERLGQFSPVGALAAWAAPNRGEGYRDFYGNGQFIEVKAVVAHTGGSITVNGLDQLDPSVPGLHLHIVRIEMGSGRTLAEYLDHLGSDGFPSKELLATARARGYSPQEGEFRMTVKETLTWKISPSMPFLSLEDIPERKRAAVESVTYSLPLGAIREPALDANELKRVLERMVDTDA